MNFERFPLIGNARALNSRGCYPICPFHRGILNNCCFSAPKTFYLFSAVTNRYAKSRLSVKAQWAAAEIFEYSNGKGCSTYLSPRNVEVPPQGAVPKIHRSVDKLPRRCGYSVHGSVDKFPRNFSTFQNARFLIRRIAKAFFRCS